MESARLISKVLMECNKELVENLNADSTIEYFFARKVLSASERDYIRLARTHIGQVGELLDMLKKKDNKTLDALIEYLDFNGNQEYLVQLLKESKKKYLETHASGEEDKLESGSDDFVLTYEHAYKLARILENDTNIQRNPKEVYIHFLEKSADRYEVEVRMDNGKKLWEGFSQMFIIWISTQSTNATLNKCIKMLEELELNKAAEAVSEKRDMLRKIK